MRRPIPDLPTTFTTSTAIAAGLPGVSLLRLRDAGELTELSRGIFRHADAPEPTHPDLLALSLRVPNGIICAVSAAAAYDLTDELLARVQIAVARGTTRPKITYPPTRVFTFEPSTFELGLTEIEAAPGEWVRIYSPPRTVVDLMKLRRQIGENIALIVLRRYLSTPDAEPGRVLEFARALKVFGPVQAALDAVGAPFNWARRTPGFVTTSTSSP